MPPGPWDLSLLLNKPPGTLLSYQLTGWFPGKPWNSQREGKMSQRQQSQGVLTSGPQVTRGRTPDT